ncbi:MAG TPA: hypothetical protein VNJ03_16500 [Vicinamibacterales bacterium]|nr:hypothetical protein [Vicinamibacterales bacterium]
MLSKAGRVREAVVVEQTIADHMSIAAPAARWALARGGLVARLSARESAEPDPLNAPPLRFQHFDHHAIELEALPGRRHTADARQHVTTSIITAGSGRALTLGRNLRHLVMLLDD